MEWKEKGREGGRKGRRRSCQDPGELTARRIGVQSWKPDHCHPQVQSLMELRQQSEQNSDFVFPNIHSPVSHSIHSQCDFLRNVFVGGGERENLGKNQGILLLGEGWKESSKKFWEMGKSSRVWALWETEIPGVNGLKLYHEGQKLDIEENFLPMKIAEHWIGKILYRRCW